MPLKKDQILTTEFNLYNLLFPKTASAILKTWAHVNY